MVHTYCLDKLRKCLVGQNKGMYRYQAVSVHNQFQRHTENQNNNENCCFDMSRYKLYTVSIKLICIWEVFALVKSLKLHLVFWKTLVSITP